jgi:hypothetical protein
MGVRFPHALLIMKEYDIGELVLHIDKFDNKKIFGLITDKRLVKNRINYTIHWADDMHDDEYNSGEVATYILNAKSIRKNRM